MIQGLESILLGSEDAKRLAKFYREKVGLKVAFEGEMGEGGNVYGFDWKGKSGFYILDHSKVKGKNKSPQRQILNFEVDNIDKAVGIMKKNEVKMIQEKYHVEGYGYIATFEDLDGNYFQLAQVREN